jgi:hypothetical protein
VAALLARARTKPGPVIRYLQGRLYSADSEEKWLAVSTLGALVREPGLLPDAKVEDLLQRFLWTLNDESGNVPFGVPEAIGEILSARRLFCSQVLPALCGMLTEEETFQTGLIERGIYWALGRIGPDVLRHCPGVAGTVADAARSHPDPDTRQAAATALEALRSSSGAAPTTS